MSGDGQTSTMSAIHQLRETNPDHIVLEKDTYLIENNCVIPIPAGTVAVLEHDTEKTAAPSTIATPGDVETGADSQILSMSIEDSLPVISMEADSLSVGDASLAEAAAPDSGSAVSGSCEVVEETTSLDAIIPSMSLSDMFVQEEEEVMEDEETVTATSVEDSTQPQSKGATRKPSRKRKVAKTPDEGQGDVAGQEVRRQKASVPVDKAAQETEKAATTSPAVATVSASGRPQRSIPRRSAYELLHGGESKPQQRHSHTSSVDSEQEAPAGKGHPSKKQKVSKSGTTDEDNHKQSEVADEAVKRQRGRPRKTSVPPEGCEGPSNCTSADTSCCVSTTEMISRSGFPPPNCTAATDDVNMVQSTGDGVANSVEKTTADVPESLDKAVKPVDDATSTSGKKPKQSKKATLSKEDNNCHPLHTAADVNKRSHKKKVAGKAGFDSKLAKIKSSKKPRVVDSKADVDDYFKVPGMPYHFFMADNDNGPMSDDDSDGSSSLDDDLASEDVEWMGRRIAELEQQVRRLQDSSVPPSDDKLTSQCWQDVLAEFHEPQSEYVDEKSMLARYERKLRMVDCELDERASFLRVREGCIARRERRILEKESELNKKARDLEHQRRLHGRVKLSAELASDSTAVSPGSTDSAAATNRKQALEKEVRLELRKQELDRQKHVLQDERKKLAAKERELENREQALVDADLLNMASGFTSSGTVDSRAAETNHPNGGTTVEFSDDDDDDFGGNSFSAFNAASASLPFSLEKTKHDSISDGTSEVSCIHPSC